MNYGNFSNPKGGYTGNGAGKGYNTPAQNTKTGESLTRSGEGTSYIQNNSDYVIYFKPESTMKVNGLTYNDNGAYPLEPGQNWNYPIDGVKTHLHKNQVFKIPGKLGFYGSVTIDKKGQVNLDFFGFGEIYSGWQSTLPAENWQKLWDSEPYKP